MPSSPATASILTEACIALERTAPSSLEDGTELARDLAELYPRAVKRCLEAGDWSFAGRIASLPELAADGADDDLPYRYALPADCVAIREVNNGLDQWRRDADCIRCDAPAPLRLRYLRGDVPEDQWPAEFASAVALTWAAMLAPKWLQTAAKVEALASAARRALGQAMRNHARDGSPVRYDGGLDEGDWVTEARR